jgi:hypothetical protein
MPTVLVPAQLTVEHLMAAIKKLSPAAGESVSPSCSAIRYSTTV